MLDDNFSYKHDFLMFLKWRPVDTNPADEPN
jgi:hypothetical protein